MMWVCAILDLAVKTTCNIRLHFQGLNLEGLLYMYKDNHGDQQNLVLAMGRLSLYTGATRWQKYIIMALWICKM